MTTKHSPSASSAESRKITRKMASSSQKGKRRFIAGEAVAIFDGLEAPITTERYLRFLDPQFNWLSAAICSASSLRTGKERCRGSEIVAGACALTIMRQQPFQWRWLVGNEEVKQMNIRSRIESVSSFIFGQFVLRYFPCVTPKLGSNDSSIARRPTGPILKDIHAGDKLGCLCFGLNIT